MTTPIRLVVDMARCDGHGICALRCPELITLDEWGYAGVDAGVVGDGRALRRARRAAAACPERALSLVAVSSSSPTDPRPLRADPAGAAQDRWTRSGPLGAPRVHNRGHEGP